MCQGFQQNERERLKIKAFSTNLTPSCSNDKVYLPDYLTLHYLPRINGSLMEINGSNIRPDSPAFVTLHRVLLKERGKEVIYASRERVVVCEGVRFAIYVGEVRVLKGIFRKDEGENWKMDCELDEVAEGVKDVEVSVAAEGLAALITRKVEMVEDRRRLLRRRRSCCELEEIPEEREEGEYGSDVCRCCECSGEEEVDGGDCEVEMEGVRWAVDVGIWVVCIGVGTVGYLVSRASSSKGLRRKRFI